MPDIINFTDTGAALRRPVKNPFESAGGQEQTFLRLLSYTEMKAMPEPEWLVEGVIQTRCAALMFGKSNSFKSFLGIDLGLSVATGHDWHGHPVKQGCVLFVATEGANGFGRLRIPSWFDYHGIPEEERQAFLYPEPVSLDMPLEVTSLIETLKHTGRFSLVVIDIFGGSMSGSEIEDKTARPWVHGIQRIIRETGASVLVIAHTGWADDTRARMHTHFWGSFDTRLKMEGSKEALTGTLSIERHKDADSSGQWGFRMEQASESLVPVHDATVKQSKKQKTSPQQRIALDALDDALKEHGARRTGDDWPPCAVVSVERWRESFYRHSSAEVQETKRRTFARSRDQLINKGQVRVFDEFAWRCFDD